MFLRHRFYLALTLAAIVMAMGMLLPPLLAVGQALLVAVVMAVAAEAAVLYTRVEVDAGRECPQRLSNGDDNEVALHLHNHSALWLSLRVIDETPQQLQMRDFSISDTLGPHAAKRLSYTVRPTRRGQYAFGHTLVFAATRLGFVERRFSKAEPVVVKVYPAFSMLEKYELLAVTDDLVEMGVKRIRRAGNNTDFDQVKEYVKGDEYRRINWKASARRGHLMVNVYQDERSQQIFSLIDKGRLMQQAFDGMTLLDYSINASLVLSYVAVRRHDKAGVMSFAEQFDSFVPAERHSMQMQRIMECLYSQQTSFGESDFSVLAPQVNRLVGKRSFVMLYTNFTDMGTLRRQLPYLRLLNRRHRLLVVFFDDPQLRRLAQAARHDERDYFEQVAAEKMLFERRLMASQLRQEGIYSLLTTPDALTVDVVNKYIEMKSRQLLS